MSAERKVIRFIDKSIDRVLTVLFLILLLIGIYFIADSWWVFNASGLSRLPGYTPETPADILKIAPDAVAWITLDDTSVSYPIVQGSDNSEYLNKNAQGEYSLSGSIFLDANNNPQFLDYYSILYGHHMAGGYMFGALDYYEKEEYFDKHRTGTLLVIDGKKYKVNVFAMVDTDASVDAVFNIMGGGDVMGYVAGNHKIYREPAEGRILALSTCKSPLTTQRTVLFTTIQEAGEAGSAKDIEKEINKGSEEKKWQVPKPPKIKNFRFFKEKK